jgi:DNA-binding NarL/FixJ family response regulator
MQCRDAESPAKVLLADDHTMFRQDLANGLGAYGRIEVVAQTNNDERAMSVPSPSPASTSRSLQGPALLAGFGEKGS